MRSFNLIRSGHEPHRAGGQAPWLRGDRLDAPHYAAHLFYRLRSISGRGAFISAALAPQCLTAIHATPQTLVGLLLIFKPISMRTPILSDRKSTRLNSRH